MTINVLGQRMEIGFTFQPGRFPQRRCSIYGDFGGYEVSGTGTTFKRAWREFYLEMKQRLFILDFEQNRFEGESLSAYVGRALPKNTPQNSDSSKITPGYAKGSGDERKVEAWE